MFLELDVLVYSSFDRPSTIALLRASLLTVLRVVYAIVRLSSGKTMVSISSRDLIPGGGGGVFPFVGYIGTCRGIRYSKEVTGLRDFPTRVIASLSLAHTSISFKNMPLLFETTGDLWIFR